MKSMDINYSLIIVLKTPVTILLILLL